MNRMNADNKENPRAAILLMDDAPLNLAALGNLLQPHYEVLAAPSGKRALQAAAGEGPLDLIPLDALDIKMLRATM